MPESGKDAIENEAMSKAVLESIIGKHGVSPAAKRSLATRISKLLEGVNGGDEGGVAAAENGGQ